MPADSEDQVQETDVSAMGETSEQEPPDYGENFANLPKEYQDKLRNLCRTFEQRNQWARMLEILRVTLARFFWVNKQHVAWNADAGAYQVGPTGGGVQISENLNEEPSFSEDFNIYTGYGKSFIAVFSQNSSPVRMEPDTPKDPRSEQASVAAQKYVRIYEKYNPPAAQQIEIGRLLWTDGRVVAKTGYMADKSRFGVDPETKKPRGTELTQFFGVLESLVPIYETDFAKWPYCKLYGDHDSCYLKEKYKDFSPDKITARAGSGNEELARMSRIATAENVTQLSQDTLKYLSTEEQWWLRPAAFRELEKADMDFFQGIFPDGCQVTFCGDAYCGASNESMDDALDVMHALPGTGQSRPALGDAEIPVQMEFNDAMNLAAECLKFAIPSIWIDQDQSEIRAIMEQIAQYGAYRPLKGIRQPQEPLENLFYAEPVVEPPTLFVNWIENLQGPLSQFVTAQQPALFGAADETQKTAHGYAQARDQALGIMAIVWIPFKSFYAKINQQAASQAARRDEAAISAVVPTGQNGKTETVIVDVATMKGGFLCTPASDENFPESPTQKSNKYQNMLELGSKNPGFAAEFGVFDPDNRSLGKRLYGLDDWTMPGTDARDKQLEEWAEMMENATGPLPDQDATAAQQQQQQQAYQVLLQTVPNAPAPPPVQPVMRSSVPIDPETDDNKTEASECLRILNSPEGQKIKKENPDVWQDLKLHYLAHKQAMLAQMPPPMPGAGPIPPPGPGAPGGAGPLPHPAPKPAPTPLPGGASVAPIQATA